MTVSSQSQLQIIQNKLTRENVQALLVTNPKNIYYCSGFSGLAPHERESLFVITPEQSYLYLPGMYAESKWDSREHIELVVDHEHRGLFSHAIQILDGISRIGFEANNLTYHEYHQLRKRLVPDSELIPTKNIIKGVRSEKNSYELAMIRRATQITDQTLEGIMHYIRGHDYTQFTEREIARMIRTISEDFGGHGLGFEPIVAYGKNSSQPHYQPSDVLLEAEGPLLIDIGIVFNHYSGDLTRTLYLGTAPNEFRIDYDRVNSVRTQAIELVRPRMTGKELHAQAVKLFARDRVDHLFIHSLGHGIGLDIHEYPSISPRGVQELHPTMVITIEPGLYRNNVYGIRIEDVLLVTTSGYELLSQTPRELVELKK